jgi:murein L,D-transpeptidase YafK
MPEAVPDRLESPRVVIHRKARRLELFDGSRLVKSYPAAMGARTDGGKEREGDRTTPLGSFYVCTRNEKSRFHLFLGLSYPAPEDAERGLARGMITKAERDQIVGAHRERTRPPWDTRLGGEVGIHGGGADRDWTLGCVALSNAHVEELWKVLRLGDSVTIRP